jgi:pilus assembly protein CpaB
MRVDVVVQGRPQGASGRGEGYVKTILQNVQVLSAGQKYQHDVEGKPVSVQSVNLLVSPEEAELLTLANSEARLQLVLRNPIDVGKAETRGWHVPDLFPSVIPSQPKPVVRAARSSVVKKPVQLTVPAVTPVVPEPLAVELWHGTKKSVEHFPLEGES